jgi:hypothetical protein
VLLLVAFFFLCDFGEGRRLLEPNVTGATNTTQSTRVEKQASQKDLLQIILISIGLGMILIFALGIYFYLRHAKKKIQTEESSVKELPKPHENSIHYFDRMFPSVEIKTVNLNLKSNSCFLCSKEFSNEKKVKLMKCGDVFHSSCILTNIASAQSSTPNLE